MNNPIAVIRNEINLLRPAFESVCSDKKIKFQSEAGFAIQAMESNSYLASVALQNRQSLTASIVNISAIGISLNPAKRQAFLVPRDNKVCLDISYMGLMDLAMATGAIMWGQALVVRKHDMFELRGLDEKPNHQFKPFDGAEKRGELVGVYVVVKTASGDYLTHTMDIGKVYAIRDRSSAWKAYKSKGKSCPWVTDEEEMIKKTCVKQAYKYWPKNERLEQAIHHMNTDGGEGIDFGSPAPQTPAGQAEAARAPGSDSPETLALINRLTETAKKGNEAALSAAWSALTVVQRQSVGATRWADIKAAMTKAVADAAAPNIEDADFTDMPEQYHAG